MLRTERGANETQGVFLSPSRAHSLRSWLDRPLSDFWCVVGWIASTALFVVVTRLLGGPSRADAGQSVYSTWAVSHGLASCTYAPSTNSGIAPLYPLFSGGVSAVAGIGRRVPFPAPAALGPHCVNAIVAMSHWALKTSAVGTTVQIGYLSWLVLMVGLIALLRASGRGRTGWEPATLLLVACAPPVLLALQEFFHPEDIVAIGLAFCGIAFVRRGSWVWAGVFLGLAIVSQQFALLVLAPLVVVAPPDRRVRFVGAAVCASAAVVVPMIIITSGRALGPLTGASATPAFGGTVLSETHLHGPVLFLVSRILPIVTAMVLARWARQRLGRAVLDPIPLVSLVATSLGLRLACEVNLFGYYLMAVGVSLIVLDMIAGRFRVSLVLWIVVVTVAFMPMPWGYDAFGNLLPIWLWQTLLVPAALALTGGPLFSAVRSHRAETAESDQTFLYALV
jgi:hypothetical protein